MNHRFLQHVTGLPGAGRIVQQVCKHPVFPLTIALTSFVFPKKRHRLHKPSFVSLLIAELTFHNFLSYFQ